MKRLPISGFLRLDRIIVERTRAKREHLHFIIFLLIIIASSLFILSRRCF